MGVFHQHAPAGLDAVNAPTGAAEQHDVAALRLDGKVFIQSADDSLFRQSDDCIQGVVGNRATVGDSDHAASTTRFEHAVHAIAMQVGAVTSAAGSDAVGENGYDLVE